MKNVLGLFPILALAACSGGGVFGPEPGPITDEQFAELKETCNLDDATLVSGDRTSSFTTDDGIPVTVTHEADSAEEKTVVLGRERSERQMVSLVMCLSKFQDSTGAEFVTDLGGTGLDF